MAGSAGAVVAVPVVTDQSAGACRLLGLDPQTLQYIRVRKRPTGSDLSHPFAGQVESEPRSIVWVSPFIQWSNGIRTTFPSGRSAHTRSSSLPNHDTRRLRRPNHQSRPSRRPTHRRPPRQPINQSRPRAALLSCGTPRFERNAAFERS